MSRARECGDKNQYPTEEEALWAATSRPQLLGTVLSHYRCRWCGYWHIGHKTRRAR